MGKVGVKRTRVPAMDRFVKKFRKSESGCWIWQAATNPRGYGIFARIDGMVLEVAHRSAWHLFVGPIPDGMMVLHKCDVRLCVNPDHLFLGSAKDNTTDMRIKWRTHSKFTEDDVLAIRNSPLSSRVLAQQYNCCRSTIKNIKSRKTFEFL